MTMPAWMTADTPSSADKAATVASVDALLESLVSKPQQPVVERPPDLDVDAAAAQARAAAAAISARLNALRADSS